MDGSDDLIRQRPGLALALTVVVAAVAYAAVSALMRRTVRPLEVGLFAVAFAVVYGVFAFYAETIEDYLGT